MAQNMGGRILGLTGIAFFLVFLVMPLAALILNSGPFPIPSNLLKNNLLQASLSALLSLLIGFPLAFALTKRTPFSRLLSTLSLMPLVLSQPAMILSIIVLFGVNGYFQLPFSLYGLGGIVLAHALYNFPLAARVIAVRWTSLAPMSLVARGLGASRLQSFLHVTLPSLRPAIISAFAIVFAFSFTSFSIPLVFGGIANSTLEVEIYRTFFRDFNFQKGAFLAFLQILIFIPISIAWKGVPWKLSEDKASLSASAKWISVLYLAIFAAILLGPMLRLKYSHVPLAPLSNSLFLAAASATLCILLWALTGKAVSRHSFLLLGISPAVLAVSYYLLPYSFILLPIGHAILSFALVSAILLPAMGQISDYEGASSVLGANSFRQFRYIRLPLLARPLALAFAFAFAFSIGETAFILSISQQFETLSMSVLRAFSAYRFAEGYFYAALLISIAVITAFVIEGSNVLSGKQMQEA